MLDAPFTVASFACFFNKFAHTRFHYDSELPRASNNKLVSILKSLKIDNYRIPTDFVSFFWNCIIPPWLWLFMRHLLLSYSCFHKFARFFNKFTDTRFLVLLYLPFLFNQITSCLCSGLGYYCGQLCQ